MSDMIQALRMLLVFPSVFAPLRSRMTALNDFPQHFQTMKPMKHRYAIRSLSRYVVLDPQKTTFRCQESALPLFVCRRGQVFQDGSVLEDGGNSTYLVLTGLETSEGRVDVGVEDYQ